MHIWLSRRKATLEAENLDVVAGRGYFCSEEILACEKAGITVTLSKPAGEKLAYHCATEENGLVLRRYWTNACQNCAVKQSCTIRTQPRRSLSPLVLDPDQIVALYATYSNISVRSDREAVLAELGRIARDKFGGRVVRNMTASLYIARRAA